MFSIKKLYLGILAMSLPLLANDTFPQDHLPQPTLDFVKSVDEFQQIPTIATQAYDYLQNIPVAKAVSRFIFVRHGESTSNQEKSIAGRKLDVVLSENGRDQAQKVGLNLKKREIPLDAVYSSPSARAQQTARLILEELKIQKDLQLDEQLYEKFYGPYEGATEQEYAPVKKIEEVHNSGPEKSFEEKFTFKAHPDMESMADIYHRITQFLNKTHEEFLKKVHEENAGQNVLVATHNGVMKALFMADAAKRGIVVDYRSFDLGNCSVVVIEVEGNDIRVVATNGLKFKVTPTSQKH